MTPPPPDAEETVQIAIRVPKSWLAQADQLTKQMAVGFEPTRTDALRAALGAGLRMMTEDVRFLHGEDFVPGKAITTAEIFAPLPPKRTSLGEWSLKADTVELVHGKDRGRYFVDLERMTDSAGTLDAIMQVGTKGWMSSADVGQFVRLVAELLEPQTGMCSGGVDGTIDVREELASVGVLPLKKRRASPKPKAKR